MMLTRAAPPALRPFVKTLWASEATEAPSPGRRELVLPTGRVHIVLRLTEPLRTFEGEADHIGRSVGAAIVGGARSTSYVRDTSTPVQSVGAELHAGAAELLLGVPADELAGRHVALDDLWGAGVLEARERLHEAADSSGRLDVLASLLTARLPKIRGVHPAVAQALSRLELQACDEDEGDVRAIVRESGYSHRRFIEIFRRAVGLTPKLYGRIVRFQRALARASAAPSCAWSAVALDAGYSDQSHFNREFKELTGMTPRRYRDAAPASPNHVPVAPLGVARANAQADLRDGEVKFLQDERARLPHLAPKRGVTP